MSSAAVQERAEEHSPTAGAANHSPGVPVQSVAHVQQPGQLESARTGQQHVDFGVADVDVVVQGVTESSRTQLPEFDPRKIHGLGEELLAVLRACPAALVIIFAVLSAASPSGAAEGDVAFLDGRPVVIDLDRHGVGDAFGVTVVVDGSATGSVLRTDVVGDVGLSLEAPVLPLTVTATDPARLELTLERAVVGSGLLVVTTGENTVLTRPVRILRSSTLAPVPAKLELRGTHLGPFSQRVHVEPLALGVDPLGEDGRCSSSLIEVGHLAAGENGATMVRDGCMLRVEGLTAAGAYEGRADLRPGEDGGDVDVSVLVRDAWGWSLLALVIGLGTVTSLDLFQRRARPRRVLLFRLRGLRQRADDEAARHGVEVDAGPLIGAACNSALAEFDSAFADTDRQRWDTLGEGYTALRALVERYVDLVEELGDLRRDADRLVDSARDSDRAAMRHALDASIVGRALHARQLGTRVELAEAEEEARAARTHLVSFAGVYERLRPVLEHEGSLADEAADVLRVLLGLGPDLADLDRCASELLRRHEAGAPRREEAPLTADAVEPLPRPPAQAARYALSAPGRGQATAGRPTKRLVRFAAGPVAAGLLLAMAALVLRPDTTKQTPTSVDEVGPSPAQSVEDDGPSTGSEAPPEAPVETRPYPRTAPVVVVPDEAVVAAGVVRPLVLLALLAALARIAWLVLRARRHRGAGLQELEGRPEELERRLRAHDLRFAVASGLLVVGTGLSVLYVPDQTFGGFGDYLALFLWGATVSEGIQLARRFLPGEST